MNPSSLLEHSLQSGAHFALHSDFASRSPTPDAECSSSPEDDDANIQLPPRSPVFADATASNNRRRVETHSHLPFEEQLALQEIRLSNSKIDVHSNAADEAAAVGASSSPKNAGLGLRGMMARMFGGSDAPAAVKRDLPVASCASAAANGAESCVDVGSAIGLSQEEVMVRAVKTRVEKIYDAPFNSFSQLLLKRRYRSLDREICSLDWLTADIDAEFEHKAQQMKVCLRH
jgi:hypothetical protein